MQKFIPPKRRSRFIAVALLLITIFAVNSCKKDQKLSANVPPPDRAATSMQQWLDKQKTDSVIAFTITNLLNQADWKTAHTIAADSGKVYEIVSLKYLPTFDDPAKTEKRYLALLVQNGNTTGYIYDLYGNAADLENKADVAISNFNNKSIAEFTGEITLSTWQNNVKKVKVYQNGSNTVTRVLTSKPGSKNTIQSTGKKVNGCTDWYWEYYENGEWVGEEYAFTTCEGGGEECAFAYRDPKGKLSVKTNCDASGQGGGHYAPDTIMIRVPHTNTLPPNNTNDLQIPNMCVFKVIEWMSKYYGGSVSYADAWVYYGQYNKLNPNDFGNIPNTGIQTNDISGYLSHFFSVQQATSTTNMFQQINNGYPMMASLVFPDGTGHEVMITGYRSDGMFEYFDPQLGIYKFESSNNLHNVYMILANQ